jgi:hypothetical protein
MKTDDLIGALVQDGATRRPSVGVRMTVALAMGGAIALALFALILGVRSDIGSAVQTSRFLLKLAVTGTALACALWACVQLARPDANQGKVLAVLAIAPALLAGAVAYELATIAPDQWPARAIGSNSRICLLAVPLLSIAPLIGLLAALRAGAPRSPLTAGAVAGLLAGALGATLYATHCIDDSPLFVALWYTPTIALMVILGAVAGRRMLRW